MRYSMFRMICRLLMASMLLLPFQAIQAGMIGADQVAAAATSQSDRASVLNLMNRSDVASQLQTLGLDPKVAKDRVAAMTEEEVRALSGQLDALPAGGSSGWAIAAVIVAVVLVYYFVVRR
jgi:hypothetical protein